MKTGPSKLFRKLALNRRTGRSMSLCEGGTCPSTISPVKDYLKARTINKMVTGPDADGFYYVKCGGYPPYEQVLGTPM